MECGPADVIRRSPSGHEYKRAAPQQRRSASSLRETVLEALFLFFFSPLQTLRIPCKLSEESGSKTPFLEKDTKPLLHLPAFYLITAHVHLTPSFTKDPFLQINTFLHLVCVSVLMPWQLAVPQLVAIAVKNMNPGHRHTLPEPPPVKPYVTCV